MDARVRANWTHEFVGTSSEGACGASGSQPQSLAWHTLDDTLADSLLNRKVLEKKMVVTVKK